MASYSSESLSTESEQKSMESTNVNGDIGHENADHEIHVTQAEVNHQSDDSLEVNETHEPVALKRNILSEETVPKDIEVNEENHNTEALPKESEIANEVPQTESVSVEVEAQETAPESEQTSESFMQMEEKNVIKRLSQIVDTELHLEVIRNDEPEEINEETTENGTEKSDESEDKSCCCGSEEKVIESEITENDDPVKKVDLKSDNSTHETQDTRVTEVKLHSYGDDSVKTDTFWFHQISQNETNETTKETPKQNGNRVDENDNEEEEDELKEIIGFKNTLKLWSSGRTGQTLDQPINSRDKFKTLKQIKKGNTRSLMEKFQMPK